MFMCAVHDILSGYVCDRGTRISMQDTGAECCSFIFRLVYRELFDISFGEGEWVFLFFFNEIRSALWGYWVVNRRIKLFSKLIKIHHDALYRT